MNQTQSDSTTEATLTAISDAELAAVSGGRQDTVGDMFRDGYVELPNYPMPGELPGVF